MDLLRAELERVLANRGIELDSAGLPTRGISKAPPRSYFEPLRLDDLAGNGAGLSWLHVQTGDYDLNGEVNISDLTPVGIYLGTNSSSINWLAAQVADGDLNGEINIADVTPIGQNFGIQNHGFVIEGKEFLNGPWQEFGFVPYGSGTKGSWFLAFGYLAKGGIELPAFRCAAVGPPRDFGWETYDLTDSAQNFQTAELTVIDSRPGIAFTAFRDSFGSRLGYAGAFIQHPVSAADWNIEYGIALDYMGFNPPALATAFHEPVIAYYADASPAADLRYLRRDAGSGAWGSHVVTTFVAMPGGLDLTTRQGLPLILCDDFGLLSFYSGVNVPSSSFDWGILASNPALTRFSNIDAVCSGPWQFAVGVSGPSGEGLAFNRSREAMPLFQSDFTEFIFGFGSNDSIYPSLVLNGGIPAVTAFDSANAAVVYIRAASRTDDTAAGWQPHLVADGQGTHARTENPEICLIDGRPAIVAGHDPMTLYWAKVANPGQTSDWHVQEIGNAQPHTTHSMLSLEGRPLIAYQNFSEAQSNPQVAIAMAQEK
jgi:hypothetical protein